MFDKYYTRTGPSHLSASVNVNEQRAPTDKSVQLLKEFESAAAKKIRDAIVVDGNVVKGKVLIVHNDCLSHSSTAYFTFELNGEEYEIKEDIKVSLYDRDPDILIRKLYEHVAAAIAGKLIMSLDKNTINDYISWYRR